MKAVHIAKYGRFPVLTQLALPQLGESDLLIRMKYAPINPSDLFFYLGKYGIIKQGFPIVGFQGSGIVEKSKDPKFIGKKVSVTANHSNGTHATHIKSSLKEVMFWPDDAKLQDVCMSFVNPISCVGLCQIVDQLKPQNVLISAAASQIGRMLISSLRSKHPALKIYGLNRSENKRELLAQLGATQTILIEDPPSQKLKQLKGKTVFLDCVGGQFAGKTFNQLGPQSQMVCYGRQSGEDLGGIDLGGLYYRNKTIRGFWLNNWIKDSKPQDIQKGKKQVVDNFNKFYKSTVRKIYKLQSFKDAYHLSTKDKSEGKILLDLS